MTVVAVAVTVVVAMALAVPVATLAVADPVAKGGSGLLGRQQGPSDRMAANQSTALSRSRRQQRDTD